MVVAQDQESVNYTSDGSPCTVSIGEVSGSTFTEWYPEILYPDEPPYVACFAAAP